MDVDLVLVPVDGGDRSARATEYAVALSAAYDADLHILNVLDESLTSALAEGDVSADTVARDHRQFTAMVRAQCPADWTGTLETSSAVGFSTARLRQTPGTAILDVAEGLEADFIVVPRYPTDPDHHDGIGRAALYVTEYASQPVLSV